jgi:hypothetical protein
MWSVLPLAHMTRRLLRLQPRNLQELATRSWEIAPAETNVVPRAFFLPGQLDRVTGWVFADEHPRRAMEGGAQEEHAATRAFLLKDVHLIDGVLYKGGACSYLQPRRSRVPELRVDQEIAHAAVFCTAAGNRYFGNWLMDDCVTYPLAAAEGVPVTTDQPVWAHVPGYESWLDMTPSRQHSVLLREAVIYQDIGQNRSKHARFRALGEKLRSHVKVQPHPGVFIVRGTTGERRVLGNEREIAEHLRDHRGFRILEPPKHDVPGIVQMCAGARTVVGLEGSGLIHGILVLPEGGNIVALQPPDRFVGVYKHMTDRDHQNFAFVVGQRQGDDLRIDIAELERTLDLLPGLPGA